MNTRKLSPQELTAAESLAERLEIEDCAGNSIPLVSTSAAAALIRRLLAITQSSAEPATAAEPPLRYQPFDVLAQGRQDYALPGFAIETREQGTMLVVGATEEAVYLSKEQAKTFFGLIDNPAYDGQPVEHTLYTTADKDRPGRICDRNGEVALSQCKVCRRAEAELSEPCVSGV